MVNTRNIAVVVCIVFAGFIISSAATSPRKLSENRSYDGGWEMDMATLDLLALALQAEPDATGYIFIYGSRRGYRNDVSKRMQCMKNYLIQRRAVQRRGVDQRLRGAVPRNHTITCRNGMTMPFCTLAAE